MTLFEEHASEAPDRIKRLRLVRRWDQTELGKAAGVERDHHLEHRTRPHHTYARSDHCDCARTWLRTRVSDGRAAHASHHTTVASRLCRRE